MLVVLRNVPLETPVLGCAAVRDATGATETAARVPEQPQDAMREAICFTAAPANAAHGSSQRLKEGLS
jgi:hypothetical protein